MPYKTTLTLSNETEEKVWIVGGVASYETAVWSGSKNGPTLTQEDSGPGGALLFKTSTGTTFAVAVGIFNWKRWVHINTKGPFDNGEALIQKYWTAGTEENDTKWKQLPSFKATLDGGRKVSVFYYEDEGNDLRATIEFY